MTPFDALSTVNDGFDYTADRDEFRFRDVWRIMDLGKLEGDCEDYALTVLWLLAGKNPARMAWWLLSRRAKIHFHKHTERGTGHASLQYRDKHVDNITRRWNDGEALKRRGYKHIMALPATFVALKLLFSLPFLAFRK